MRPQNRGDQKIQLFGMYEVNFSCYFGEMRNKMFDKNGESSPAENAKPARAMLSNQSFIQYSLT